MAALPDDRQYAVVDALQHQREFETSRGVMKTDDTGYLYTRDAELAKEIEQRNPGVLATEFGGYHGDGKAVRGQSMVQMPSHWNGFENAGAELVLVNGHWTTKEGVSHDRV